MARPRRLYYDEKTKKYFFIVSGKRRYIRKPKDLSEKQLVKINIKNIIGEQVRKPKKRKRRIIKLEKKIVPELSKGQVPGSLPVYLFTEKKKFPTIESIVKNEEKDNNKLVDKAIKDAVVPILAAPPTLPALPAPPSGAPTGSPRRQMRPTLPTIENVVEQSLKYNKATEILNIKGMNMSKLGNRINVFEEIKTRNPTLKFGDEEKIGEALKNQTNWKKFVIQTAKMVGEGESESKGEGSGDDGLYNDEISKILKSNIKDFIPVIPSDKVNDMIRYVKPGDKRFGFIVNTNPSSSDGTGNDGMRPGHWRAVFIDNDPEFETTEYFDPLAEGPPEKSLIKVMHAIGKKMNPERMFKLKVNYLKRQADNTGTCGYHCIDFLNKRYNGESWSSASGYDKYIEENKPDFSNDGERDISKKIKKYKSYL